MLLFAMERVVSIGLGKVWWIGVDRTPVRPDAIEMEEEGDGLRWVWFTMDLVVVVQVSRSGRLTREGRMVRSVRRI